MNAFITQATKAQNAVTPTSANPLDYLAEQWLQAKEDEQQANSRRRYIEQQIIDIVGVAEEGTTNKETDTFKIKTVGKLTRSLNDQALQEDWDSLPAEIKKCVKWKSSLDVKNLRSLESMRDDLVPVMSKYLTTKPAKASVSVEAK